MKLSHASIEITKETNAFKHCCDGGKIEHSIYNLSRVPHKNSPNNQICSYLKFNVVAASDEEF